MQLAIRKTGFSPGMIIVIFIFIILGLAIFISSQVIGNSFCFFSNILTLERIVLIERDDDIPRQIINRYEDQNNVEINIIDDYRRISTLPPGGVDIFDIAIVNNNEVPIMVEERRLAEIRYSNIPNFKYISPDFRDLSFDPKNRHSIPFNWGTTGLIVNNDLVDILPVYWKDLWNSDYQNKIVYSIDSPIDLSSLTLKSLGYSINSKESNELTICLLQMLALKPGLILVNAHEEALDKMINAEAAIMIGRAEDIMKLQKSGKNFSYIIPKEGTILWGENLVISAASKYPDKSENFINYILEPEVNAKIVKEKYIATPNASALFWIETYLMDNSMIFPKKEDLINAEVYLPNDKKSILLHKKIWKSFINDKFEQIIYR